MTATDDAGVFRSYLASESSFAIIRDLETRTSSSPSSAISPARRRFARLARTSRRTAPPWLRSTCRTSSSTSSRTASGRRSAGTSPPCRSTHRARSSVRHPAAAARSAPASSRASARWPPRRGTARLRRSVLLLYSRFYVLRFTFCPLLDLSTFYVPTSLCVPPVDGMAGGGVTSSGRRRTVDGANRWPSACTASDRLQPTETRDRFAHFIEPAHPAGRTRGRTSRVHDRSDSASIAMRVKRLPTAARSAAGGRQGVRPGHGGSGCTPRRRLQICRTLEAAHAKPPRTDRHHRPGQLRWPRR